MTSSHPVDRPDRVSFRVGEWLVQPGLNRISRGSLEVQLEPRAMNLLVYLAARPGQVVSRRELIDAVWDRTFVADATLSHAVAQLRSALNDDARQPTIIETIPKRGYRLIARVSDAKPLVRADGRGGAEVSPDLPRIAVLPFADMSPECDQEYLCDGIVEEITNALAQLGGLRVAARTSAFAFRGTIADAREVGRKLAVGWVLEGSVRKSGDRLRITVQLIDVATGYHVWLKRFDRNGDDIFAIQDEIAMSLVERLEVDLREGEQETIGRRRTMSREAYDLHMRGRYFVHRRRPGDLQSAIAAFEQAIALDPDYSSPHIGIAEAFSILGLWGFLPPALACGRARDAAARAVEIDEASFEGHAWLGSVLYLHEWKWQEAARHCERAIELPPPSGTAQFGVGLHLLAERDWDRARALEQRITAEESLSAAVHTQAGGILTGLGDFHAGTVRTQKALELDPEMPAALHGLGHCRAALGRFDTALPPLQAALAREWTPTMCSVPEVLVRLGRRDEALELVRALEEKAREHYVTPLIRAFAWAALGEKELSLALLAEAEADRSPLLILFLAGRGFRALAPAWVEEWFVALGRRIGFDAAARGARGPTARPG